MSPIELSPECLPIPSLSENATDDEIRAAWNVLTRSKEALSARRREQAQRTRALYRDLESRKARVFQKALGEIQPSDLDEKAGEEKSKAIGKELAAIKKGMGPEQDGLRALG